MRIVQVVQLHCSSVLQSFADSFRLVWDSIQNIIFWQNKGLHCEKLIRKCHQSWLEVNLYWNHHPIKTIMSGIYGGYALENGLTSPTGEHTANLQTSNMSQWVILLLKHDWKAFFAVLFYDVEIEIEVVQYIDALNWYFFLLISKVWIL